MSSFSGSSITDAINPVKTGAIYTIVRQRHHTHRHTDVIAHLLCCCCNVKRYSINHCDATTTDFFFNGKSCGCGGDCGPCGNPFCMVISPCHWYENVNKTLWNSNYFRLKVVIGRSLYSPPLYVCVRQQSVIHLLFCISATRSFHHFCTNPWHSKKKMLCLPAQTWTGQRTFEGQQTAA